MSDEIEHPERGYTTKDVAALHHERRPSFARRHWGKLTLAAIILIPSAVFTLWAVSALHYTYSTGERVGYVQKFSRRGWLCKTYEGELAMSNVPGVMPEKFYFTVRDDSIARVVNDTEGKHVALRYEQHTGLPTSCFGETEYFIVGVRVLP